MTHLALFAVVQLYLGQKVASLGGFLVSVQTRLTGLDDPKSISWKHGCAGTVLRADRALTCASCLVYYDDRLGQQTLSSDELRLYGGNQNPDHADSDTDGQIVLVKRVYLHPEFLNNEIDNVPNINNFALLMTKKAFLVGDAIKVLPLYSEDVEEVLEGLAGNGTCFTMTWFFYMNGTPVEHEPDWGELSVELGKIGNCANLSTLAALGDGLCAKSNKRMPICRVDTGAPVVCQGKLMAVIINDKLNCDNDEEYVVLTGINNALAFIANPELYSLPESKPSEEVHTTIVRRGIRDRQSSQIVGLSTIAALVPGISIVIR